MKKSWNKYKDTILGIIVAFLLIATPAIIGYLIGHNKGYKKGKAEGKFNYTPPVEKNVIDTLYITKDSLINKVKYLEVIKHDTIEKVYYLDDTATLLLFYQLVSDQHKQQDR